MGFLSDVHAGMRAAMRLSTAQQTKAMRKSVGVKNMSNCSDTLFTGSYSRPNIIRNRVLLRTAVMNSHESR